MAVIIVCLALVLAGLVVVVRWAGSPSSRRPCQSRIRLARRGGRRAWSCVATFAALVVLHGLLVAALAGRLSRAVPLLAAAPGAIAAHAPLLLLLLAPVALLAAIVGVVVVVASRIPQVVAAVQSPRLVMVGRAAWSWLACSSSPGSCRPWLLSLAVAY